MPSINVQKMIVQRKKKKFPFLWREDKLVEGILLYYI
jgi:hypothetical protein